MLEIPESTNIARQLNETIRGKTIVKVIANASPHKFAFYCGDPDAYPGLLAEQTVGDAQGMGAMVEISVGDRRIVLGDGANIRYFSSENETPAKHQLLLTFDDGSILTCSLQMYGTVLAFKEGGYDSEYYLVAKEKPLPLSGAFDAAYFGRLRDDDSGKLSAKAFLATQQRIPGLGNGVLQDILFHARLHPKRKMSTVSDAEYEKLFFAVKDTLASMTALNGRDTEKDLFGNFGGYTTILSKNTVGKPCPVCGTTIEKAAYMGGAVYWCSVCQSLA